MWYAGCKNCDKRYIGCHSECEDYQNYKNELEDMKAKIRKAKRNDSEMRDYVKKRNIKKR